MARKSTTRAFREYAVAMINSGKALEEVAEELQVEIHKLKRWCESSPPCSEQGFMQFHGSFNTAINTGPSLFGVSEKQRLEHENKCLKELLQHSANWISFQLATQREFDAKN